MQSVKNSDGLTLLETLISLTIIMTIIIGILYWYLERQREQQALIFGKDIVSIITAFDKRIHVDGLDINNFKNGTEWVGENAFISMLGTEFIAQQATCGGANNWNPVIDEEKSTQLIPCNFWAKSPYNFDIKAKITPDTDGFIKNFKVIFQSKNQDIFSQNFRYYNKAIMTAKANDSLNITGGHQFYFASNTDTSSKITNKECLSLKSNCVLVATYDREGGNEYLRVDGSNSMIGSSVTFKAAKENDKLRCLKWVQDAASGSWISSNVDCGIGIHTETGYPVAVDVVVDSATSKNIMLDRLCPVYTNTADGLVDSTTNVPCGITTMEDTGATVAYQVVDNISAQKGLVNKLYTDTIFSNTVNTNYMKVKNDLTVNGNTIMDGTLNVKGTTQFDSNINLTEIETEGASCNPNGSVSRNAQGAILSCISGYWTNTSGATLIPVGTFGGNFGGEGSGDHYTSAPVTYTVGKYSSCFLTSFYAQSDTSGSGCQLSKKSNGVWTITTLTKGGGGLSCSVGCLQ